MVTGASSGIGELTAARLARAGHVVVGAARRTDAVSLIPGVIPLRLDLTDETSITDAVESAVDRIGAIDVLINNAGYGEFGALEDTPIDRARLQFEVNVFGLIRLTQLVAGPMRQRGAGRIVNVSSLAGEFSSPLAGWYHASKHSLEALSDSLRHELRPFGVEVVVVQPGPVRTPWHDDALAHLASASGDSPYAGMAATVATYHRTAQSSAITSEPDDVAAAIERVATMRRPRPRYRVGRGAGMAVAMSRLPDRWFDAMTRQQFGLA
ncbi:MAG TPA: oxidoreductase [Nocardioidaceae bacterium]|nr:oxidoreductase [Nocardioidaceae bacterium]